MEEKFIRKLVPLVVVGLVVLCGLEVVALPFDMAETSFQKWEQTPYTSLNRADILDQSQPFMDQLGLIGWSYGYNTSFAQSFKPTLNMLTRVELMIDKLPTTTYECKVSIRDDLNESDLTSVSLPASEIITLNISWIEFDFPDLLVTPGDTYYIVCSTINVTNNTYRIGYEMGSLYPNGTLYYTIEGRTWKVTHGGIDDMTFNTYGMDINAPNLNLTITGGIGVTVNTKNVGELDATNVKTHITISGGILGRINISKDVESATLAIGGTLPFKIQPLGLGLIAINVVACADNAAQVTKTTEGFILLFFVIIN